MKTPESVVREFPGAGELVPFAEAIVAATGIKPETVPSSPLYRGIPREYLGGRAYAKRSDLIAFFEQQRERAEARRAQRRLRGRRPSSLLSA